MGHWGEAVTADVLDPHTSQNLGAGDPAWEAFQERYPGEWQSTWDTRTRRPHWIYGPGIEVATGSLDDATAMIFASEFLEENAALFGIESVMPVLPEPYSAGHTVIMNVTFEKDGVAVDDRSRVGFRYKDHGVLAAVCASNLPLSYEPSEPTVAADDAIRIGAAASGRPASLLVVSQEPVLQYLPDDEMRARLTWRFELRNEDLEDPFAMEYFVTARDEPMILDTLDGVHYIDVEGKVEANVILFDPVSTPTTEPLEHLRVDISSGGSGEALTDANGDYTIPFGGAGSITVRSVLEGPWVRVINTAGSNEVLTQNGTPPGPFDFLHNPSGTPEDVLAQAQGHFHTNIVHDFHEGIIGASGADISIPCNVNIGSSCNAFFNGTINFFQSSGSCRNTCYDTVVYHEYGHFLDNVYGAVRQPYSEGISDVYAMYITDQPVVGKNFFFNGGFIRTGENTRQWPASECNGSVHCVGEVIGGFFWKLRVNLKNTHGAGPGGAIADQLAVFVNATDPLIIPDAAFETFVIDDDDGNMGNGTPNFFDIKDAADQHSLESPNPVFVDIRHIGLDNTIDQVNDRPVVATITSNAGAITDANLFYSVNGGAFAQAVMAPTGTADEFGASIPAQPCGSSVRYYIEADDAMGFTHTYPGNAPIEDVCLYVVARKNTFYFEDFESGLAGWLLIGDDFAAGTPNQEGDNPWDPTVAASGSQVLATGLNTDAEGDDGFYTSGGFSQARTPTIDASGHSNVHLTFKRWLTVQDRNGDFAEIAVKNGDDVVTEVWQNATQSGGELMNSIDRDWTPVTYDLTGIADNDSEVKIAFRLGADDSVEFGGWNLDDVELFSTSCDVVKLTTSDDSPSIGGPVSFTTEGAPNADFYLLSANGFGDGSFQVPGGPLVETGLNGGSTRVRRQGSLDGAGQNTTSRNVPNNGALIGRTFVLVSISDNAGWQASNTITLLIDP